MSEEKIKAESRTQFGKGAARRIRRDDKVPAVLYGHGSDPMHITLPGHDTMMALKHGGSNALLYLDIEGTTHLALTKQIQADPIKGFLEHIDFVEVKKGEKVTVDIPIHVLGESKSDAMTVTELNNVSVEAEATNIPEYLEISVEDADAGFQVFAKDIELPAGLGPAHRRGLADRQRRARPDRRGGRGRAGGGRGRGRHRARRLRRGDRRGSRGRGRVRTTPGLTRAATPAPTTTTTRAESRFRREPDRERCGRLAGRRAGQPRPVVRRAPGTTSATSSPTSWPDASAAAGAPTRRAAPTSSRDGWALPARLLRGSCSRDRAAT